VQRFLRKLWGTCRAAAVIAEAMPDRRFAAVDQADLQPKEAAFRRAIHLTLKQALHDYARVQYNTVVSACMKMLNSVDEFCTVTLREIGHTGQTDALVFEALSVLIRTLYPIAPHVTHALWKELGFAARHGDLLDAPWPVVDERALAQAEIEVVVQINGKLRGRVVIPVDADEDAARAAALADATVRKFVEGKPVRKAIYVRGKLVNLVV
jgi:leucyl-tRNA synthetase